MIGCRCSTCRSTDPRDRRWRSSIHIELADGTSVLVDASPDLRAQALAFDVLSVDVILLTHCHADHVLGLDDVRPFNIRLGCGIPCYGDDRTISEVRHIFSYVFDSATRHVGGIPQLVLKKIAGIFSIGQSDIIPIPIYHGKDMILGYRIGNFAYLTDCSEIPDSSWPLLSGVQVLVLNALRKDPHPTHFSLSQAIDVATRIGPTKTYFTHICHDLPHAETCVHLPDNFSLAYDGLSIEVNE